jgi:hypothetical protein
MEGYQQLKRINTMKTPILDFNQEFGRWSLRLQDNFDSDTTYEMLINVSWGEPHTYRFIRWEDGEWFEVMTKAELIAHIQDIRDHEGDGVADLWMREQEQVCVVRDNHPVFALRKHWEALMTLELIHPVPTLREWKGKPLPVELRDRIDAIHRAEMEATIQEMAAELPK